MLPDLGARFEIHGLDLTRIMVLREVLCSRLGAKGLRSLCLPAVTHGDVFSVHTNFVK
jgi:hypothetical protein